MTLLRSTSITKIISGDEKETTICKNKVSLTGPGTWFSAKKVCVHYVTNDVSAKNGRIIQFNGGLMTKDAYKGKPFVKDSRTAKFLDRFDW